MEVHQIQNGKGKAGGDASFDAGGNGGGGGQHGEGGGQAGSGGNGGDRNDLLTKWYIWKSKQRWWWISRNKWIWYNIQFKFSSK